MTTKKHGKKRKDGGENVVIQDGRELYNVTVTITNGVAVVKSNDGGPIKSGPLEPDGDGGPGPGGGP